MVFKSLILRTIYSGLKTMVMTPAGYKRLDVCILGFVRKLMHGAATSKTVTDAGTTCRALSAQEQWRWVGLSPSVIDLRIALLRLLQRVLVAGPSLLQCLAGSLLSHMIVSLMKSCVSPRILGLSSSGRTCTVSRKLIRVNVVNFCCCRIASWICLVAGGLFFRILNCSELRYRYFNISVSPIFEGTVGQENPVEPDAPTWVCDCTRKGGLLCGAKFSAKKTAQKAYHAYIGKDSWFTFVEHACTNHQCFPVVSARLLQPHYNVTARTETTGSWNVQYRRSVESG